MGATSTSVLLLVALAFSSCGDSTKDDREPRSFIATADTFIDESYPSANFGASTTLEVDRNPAQWSLFRFEVSGTDGPIEAAFLRLYIDNGSDGTGGVAWKVHGD